MFENYPSKPTVPSAESAQRHSAHPVLANTQLRNLFVLCAFAGVVYILVPGNLRCSEKSHCLSAASLRFF